jgi:hypothetical protein
MLEEMTFNNIRVVNKLSLSCYVGQRILDEETYFNSLSITPAPSAA